VNVVSSVHGQVKMPSPHSQNVLAIKVWQHENNNIKQNKHRPKLIIALVQMWSLVSIQLSVKIWHKCRHSQNVPSIKISHCETLINKLYCYNTRKLQKSWFACQLGMWSRITCTMQLSSTICQPLTNSTKYQDLQLWYCFLSKQMLLLVKCTIIEILPRETLIINKSYFDK